MWRPILVSQTLTLTPAVTQRTTSKSSSTLSGLAVSPRLAFLSTPTPVPSSPGCVCALCACLADEDVQVAGVIHQQRLILAAATLLNEPRMGPVARPPAVVVIRSLAQELQKVL